MSPYVGESDPGELRQTVHSVHWEKQRVDRRNNTVDTSSNSRTYTAISSTPFRTQSGWRSSESDGPSVEHGATGGEYLPWGKTRTYITELDEIISHPNSRSRVGNFVVNDRDYYEYLPSGQYYVMADWSIALPWGVYDYSMSGRDGLRFVTSAPPAQKGMSDDGTTSGDVGRRLRGVRPTKPHAGLSVFIAELGDLPRTVSTLLANARLKKLSDGPINAQFGVIPVVSDIRSLADAVKNSQKYVQQFLRDSGSVVRRSTQWTTVDEVTNLSLPSGAKRVASTPPDVTLSIARSGTRRHTITHHVGAHWQYYVADPGGFTTRVKRYDQLADHLLGLKFTASTFWELVPWSWLVDWSVDIGGLISYQEDVRDDSLVCRGGFHSITEKWTDKVDFTAKLVHASSGTHGSVTQPSSLSYDVKTFKRRRRQSPYAWSADAAVTPRRAAILASLGLSRAV